MRDEGGSPPSSLTTPSLLTTPTPHPQKEARRMLKLTYTDVGLHLERMATPLETLVAQRVVLALRAGQRLYIEPGKASFCFLLMLLDLLTWRWRSGRNPARLSM